MKVVVIVKCEWSVRYLRWSEGKKGKWSTSGGESVWRRLEEYSLWSGEKLAVATWVKINSVILCLYHCTTI